MSLTQSYIKLFHNDKNPEVFYIRHFIDSVLPYHKYYCQRKQQIQQTQTVYVINS